MLNGMTDFVCHQGIEIQFPIRMDEAANLEITTKGIVFVMTSGFQRDELEEMKRDDGVLFAIPEPTAALAAVVVVLERNIEVQGLEALEPKLLTGPLRHPPNGLTSVGFNFLFGG